MILTVTDNTGYTYRIRFDDEADTAAAGERLRQSSGGAPRPPGECRGGMRFDCNDIADIMSEVAAYGTAVTIRPRVTSGAAVTD